MTNIEEIKPLDTINQATQPQTEPTAEMSEAQSDEQSVPEEAPKKMFTRETHVPIVKVKLAMPDLLPGYEPFEFDCRLALSAEMDEKRQEFLSQSIYDQTVGEDVEALKELCDVLVSVPRGFGDIQEIPGLSAGDAFKQYIEHAPSHQRDLLNRIVTTAMGTYWRMVTPRIFRA